MPLSVSSLVKEMNKLLENENPVVYQVASLPSRSTIRRSNAAIEEEEDNTRELIDALEVFELIRNINDPEHPLTLEQLHVAQVDDIIVDDSKSHVEVRFTPTIPHCSMATLIGLCIRVRLLRSLPERFKVDILINKGTHQSEVSVNKQLNDKERVAAAMENTSLISVVNQCLANC